ncbi:integrase [Lewinella aquimaris]|uniref:Integrase n=1 Tax=Neolewinella aquimaris TaxID=1835722 RepID=A0A840E851_9BACT|nr:hypothetical protein [Neolewinella aquimaris]MBB4077969.1 integrase [Neolewinella aquimaris]
MIVAFQSSTGSGNHRYNSALLIGAGIYLGLRIWDILQLRWDQIQADQFLIKGGKTGKERTVDVHGNFLKLARRVGGALQTSAEYPGLVSGVTATARRRSRWLPPTGGYGKPSRPTELFRRTLAGARPGIIGATWRYYIGLTQETISEWQSSILQIGRIYIGMSRSTSHLFLTYHHLNDLI